MHPPCDDRTLAVVRWPVPGCSACFSGDRGVQRSRFLRPCQVTPADGQVPPTAWAQVGQTGGPAEAGPGSLLAPAFLPCQPNSSYSEMGQGHGRRTGKFSCLLAVECSTGLLASSLLPAACSVYHFKMLPLFIIGAVVIL